MTTNEMYQELTKVIQGAERLLKESGYSVNGECEPADIEEVYKEPNLYQKYLELCKSLDMLEQMRVNLAYYQRPIQEEGVICYNPTTKRYYLNDDEFHCGDGMEVLIPDSDDAYMWTYTSIESEWQPSKGNPNYGGYYLTKCGKNIVIEGLRARKRKG